jgi:hypothetical protein
MGPTVVITGVMVAPGIVAIVVVVVIIVIIVIVIIPAIIRIIRIVNRPAPMMIAVASGGHKRRQTKDAHRRNSH